MKKNLFIHLLPILFFSEACYSYVEIDTKAPDFTLSNSFGEEISLSEFSGKKKKKKLLLSGQIMAALL